MRRSLFVSILMVVCGCWAVLLTHASHDVDGTIWDFEARMDVFADEPATFDGDGTQLNGWRYYDGIDSDNSRPFDIPGGAGNSTGEAKWVLGGSGGVQDQDFGLARQNPGADGFGFFKITPDYTPNTGFTYEWRMKVLEAGNDTTDKISVQITTAEVFNTTYSWVLNWTDQPDVGNGANQIVAERGGEVFALDTRSNFVTYRLVFETQNLNAAGPSAADGVLLGNAAGQKLSGSNRGDFGRLSGSTHASVIGADWDFVKLHSSATTPDADPPVRPPRPSKDITVIEAGFSTPDTVYLGKNVAQLEGMGFDGMGTWIAAPQVRRENHGSLSRPGGRPPDIVNEQLIWPDGGAQMDPAHLTAPIADMQPTKNTTLGKNFRHLFFSNYLGPMNGFDDGWWGDITFNVQQMAHFAAESGMSRFLIDPDQYVDKLFDFNELKANAPQLYRDKSWEDMRAIVRQRGREFIQAVNAKMPEPIIFMERGYHSIVPQSAFDPANMKNVHFGLLGAFIDGMLEGSSDQTVIVDGSSNGWTHASRSQFEEAREWVLYDPIELGFTEVLQAYQDKMRLGFGMYLDAEGGVDPSLLPPGNDGKWDPNNPQNNWTTPADLQNALQLALEIGDRYVWFWNELPYFFLPAIHGAPFRSFTSAVHPDYVTALQEAKALFAVPGDLNRDGQVTPFDIDLLRDAINTFSTDPVFDVNGDTLINSTDVNHMVITILGTMFGDINLDQIVDGTDLAILRANMGTTAAGILRWDQGNVVGDGAIDPLEVLALRHHFGFIATSPQPVPEPISIGLLSTGTLGLSSRR